MGLKEYLFGKTSEDKACEYLKGLGFKILERNFHSKFGEIDIIAIDENSIVSFVEVKASEKYDAAFRLTKGKMDKIIKTINYYLMINKLEYDFEISFIIINGCEIKLIRNISL
ncbi:hypothetical protein BFG05_06865 [Campylobacter pinnipediorum subsp. pinnipediorum]|uniref:YraN family protein n=1 Tax=Campylobacter pinnipediorum TaxID=1965231 RepID=UPI00099514F0|nr:YraN family protein [Campylobacter pinnipediorum]OPA74962.1 hypothetical protein BFG05_06865 [Campylobacter pinnipediorum subsp. pinnipediorum]